METVFNIESAFTMKQALFEFSDVCGCKLRASLNYCVFRFQRSIPCLIVLIPVSLIFIAVCKLESTFPMPHPLLELTNIVVARVEVLFSKSMKQTILEYPFIYRVRLVKDFLPLAVLSVRKVVTRITLILCLMFSIPL